MNSNFGSSLGQGTISSSGMSPSFSQIPYNQTGTSIVDGRRAAFGESSGTGMSGASFRYVPQIHGPSGIEADLNITEVVRGMTNTGQNTLSFYVGDVDKSSKFILTVSIKDGQGPHIVNAFVPGQQQRGQFSSYPTYSQQGSGISGISPGRDFPTASSRRYAGLTYLCLER